jgi:glycosyltransferase involved in cell wall biosynthesis
LQDNYKIFIGTSVHRWNDNRIFHKEAVSLAKKFNVELHAPADFDKKNINGVNIIGLPTWEKETDRKLIRKQLWLRLKNNNSDIFIFHDPELIWIGIKASIVLKIKVVYDIHENTIQSIIRKKWLNPIAKLIAIIGYSFLQQISKLFFDHYFLAENSYRNFIKKNSTVIYNYPLKVDYDHQSTKEFDLVYLGDITEDRGALIMVKILSILKRKLPKINLALIGKVPPILKDDLANAIVEYRLKNNIKLFGYINYYEAMQIVCKSKVGLCLLKPIKNYIDSYPTKLFDYLQVGVPCICSNFPLYQKLIDKYDAGISVDPLDIEGVATAIYGLLDDPDKYNNLSKNGIIALNNDYNWSTQENKLFNLVQSF